MLELIRNIAEIGFGVLFVAGAIFHLSYTLRHGGEVYQSMTSNTWLSPYQALMRTVIIPNARLTTVLLISFQASIGLMILTRGGLVEPALIAGALFSLLIIPASSFRGVVANLTLAIILLLLVLAG